MTATKQIGVVIIGAGGHGSELISYVSLSPATAKLLGVIDDNKTHGEWNTTQLLGPLNIIPEILLKHGGPLHFITAVGSNPVRQQLVARVHSLRLAGLRWFTLIHPSSIIGLNCHLGEGSLVGPMVNLTHAVSIGAHCIVNVKSSISHDCIIGDFVNINPGATIAGNCHIGDRAYIGAGAIIIQNIKVGRDAVIGAGAVVIHDVPEGVTVVGVPAKVITGKVSQRVARSK